MLNISHQSRSALLNPTDRRRHIENGHGLGKKTTWGDLQDASNEEKKLHKISSQRCCWWELRFLNIHNAIER